MNISFCLKLSSLCNGVMDKNNIPTMKLMSLTE